AQEQSIINVAKQRIYLDLIKSSGGMTEAEARTLYHFENDNINIEYLQIPFDEIPDSLVSVSDAEVKQYIKSHEKAYERSASRNLQYVLFDESPTEDDLAAIRLRLEGLKDEQIAYNDVSKLTDTIQGFRTAENIIDFVDRYSEIPFDSIYRPRGEFNNEYADILFGLEVGEVFGPYRDGNYFKISRLLDRKEEASLRASHILIAFEGATRAPSTVTRSKAEAQREANRVLRLARRSGADFEGLARKYSDGPTKTRGGDLGFFQEGQMAEPFFDFVNKNRVGRIGLVETEFGFHIIKVTDKDDLAMIADVANEAVASDETANEIFRKATQFEIESIDASDFIGSAEKYQYTVRPVKQITALEENLPGLFNQRQIVRWAYDDETRIGDVQRFTLSSGGYAVVQLTAINKKGLASIDEVGAEVRNKILQDKKAALIEKQYANETLEALAEKEVFTLETASAINQKNPTLVGAGNEPYVVGAAFTMEEGAVSGLIQGERGMYKIKVLKKNEAEPLEDYLQYSREYLRDASFRLLENIFVALESNAAIEDNRALYY
ncbi:MAG: peptidylprolyl isomerase, partial [Flavobacteriaceae bacterium]